MPPRFPDPTTDPMFSPEVEYNNRENEEDEIQVHRDVGESRRPQSRGRSSRGRSETSIDGFDFLCRSSAGSHFEDLQHVEPQTLWEENPRSCSNDGNSGSPRNLQPRVALDDGDGGNDLPNMIRLPGDEYAAAAKAAGRGYYSIPAELPTPRFGPVICCDTGCQTDDFEMPSPNLPAREGLVLDDSPVAIRKGSPAVRFRGNESPILSLENGAVRSPGRKNESAAELGLVSPPPTILPRKSSLRDGLAEALELNVNLRVTVVEALGLAKKRWISNSYPYCLVDVQGQVQGTRVEPKTQNPRWDETVSFVDCSLTSRMRIQVVDKHAPKAERLMGMAQLRVVDIVHRARLGKSRAMAGQGLAVSMDSWFELRQRSGAAASGRVHVNFMLEHKKGAELDQHTTLDDIAQQLMASEDEGEGSRWGGQLLGEQADWVPSSALDDYNIAGPETIALEEGADSGFYAARSWWVFGGGSRVRRWCFDRVQQKRFASWSLSTAFVSFIVFALDPKPPMEPAEDGSVGLMQLLELAMYACLGLEIAMQTIALGVWGGAGSFMSVSLFNVFEAASFVAFWVELALPAAHSRKFTLRPFRAFRFLVPLTSFSMFSGLAAIFISLKTAIPGLLNVLYFLLIFFMGFGIFGVTFYNNSFSRRCVVAGTDTVILPETWCKIDELNPDVSDVCGSHGQCAVVGNPFLQMHFDHIGAAIGAIFQSVSLDGQYEIMNRALQSEPVFKLPGFIFFVVLAFFCRFVVFNLCVAVIATTFQSVRREDLQAAGARPPVDGSDTNRTTPQPSRGGSRPSSAKVGPEPVGNGRGGEPTAPNLLRPESSAGNPWVDRSEDGRRRGSTDSWSRGTRSSRAAHDAEGKLSLHQIVMLIVEHPSFHFLAMCIVLVNTFSLALQGTVDDESQQLFLKRLITWSSMCFVLELVLKMLGSDSLADFFRSGTNIFDFLTISLTAMSLFAQVMGVSERKLGILLSISALRFVRVVAQLPTLRYLLQSGLASITNITNLVLFIFINFTVFAIAGKYLFGGTNEREVGHNEANFQTYRWAMVTLFQVMSGDQWRLVMASAMEPAYNRGDSWGVFLAGVFVCAFFFYGQTVLANLFVAVIVENFDIADTQGSLDSDADAIKMVFRHLRRLIRGVFDAGPRRLGRMVSHYVPQSPKGRRGETTNPPAPRRRGDRRASLTMHMQLTKSMKHDAAILERIQSDKRLGSPQGSFALLYGAELQQSKTKDADAPEKAVVHSTIAQIALEHAGKENEGHLLANMDRLPITGTKQDEFPLAGAQSTRSWGVFTDKSLVRRACHAIAESRAFYVMLLAAIFVSCFVLAIEPPSDDIPPMIESLSVDMLRAVDLIAFVFFVLEFVVKTIQLGVRAYVRSPWNKLDAAVLLLALLDLIGGGTRETQVLRLGRALRPVRFVNRNSGMRLIVDSILRTWRPVLMIMLLACTVSTMFAIIGMSIFRDRFGFCTDATVAFPHGRLECTGNRYVPEQGILLSRSWLVPDQNFDNFGRAVMSLFAANTFKVSTVLQYAIDITGPQQSPVTGYSVEYAGFFALYVLVGALMTMVAPLETTIAKSLPLIEPLLTLLCTSMLVAFVLAAARGVD